MVRAAASSVRAAPPSASGAGGAQSSVRLPFSVSSIETVRELLRLRETERGLLRGKTGTAGGSASHAALGWFVGYVQHAGNSFAFATNIEGPGANGIRAREIAEEILKHKGLL